MNFNIYILTCSQLIVPVAEQTCAATSSHVTTIIHVAEKVSRLGNTVRILFVPCCKIEKSVVVRYQRDPPFKVFMSVQNGAIILCDPFIGKAYAVNWLNAVPNVTSPLVLTCVQKYIYYLLKHTNWRYISNF